MSYEEFRERQKVLESFAQPNWVEARDERWKKLPGEIRQHWLLVHGRKPGGGKLADDEQPDWERREVLERELAERLDAMDAATRAEIFAASFPRLATYLADAWELQKRLPYQIGAERKGLRAPQWPEATREARGQWLHELVETAGPYDQDLPWFAEWAGHIAPYMSGEVFGILLAVALNRRDATGDEVFTTLASIVDGSHPTAQMSSHVTRALLVCERPEAWELVERLLLAAQRQEGVRQMILECVDEAHPEAFRRMVRLIRDGNLVRFSSVVRAFDVWLGLRWDSASAGVVQHGMDRLYTFMTDEAARAAAWQGKDAEDVYFALYAIGIDDVAAVEPPAERLLASSSVEVRFATAWFLIATGIVRYFELVSRRFDDPDPRLRYLAALAMSVADVSQLFPDADHFARLQSIFDSFPQATLTVKPLVWPWQETRLERSVVADAMVASRGTHAWGDIVPYASSMSAPGRSVLATRLAAEKDPDPAVRAALLNLTGDASPDVRNEALQALGRLTPTPGEIEHLEKLLTRQAGDLRRGVLRLLVNQTDEAALASARRLLAQKKSAQRLAGLEVLRLLQAAHRAVPQVRAIADAMAVEDRKRSPEEEKQLAQIRETGAGIPGQEEGFGLYDPRACTPGPVPRDPGATLITPTAVELIRSLDELIHEHREEPVAFSRWRQGEKEEHLLGACTTFPTPDFEKNVRDDIERLPLHQLWERWWSGWADRIGANAPAELLRAATAFDQSSTSRYYFEPTEESLDGFGWKDDDDSRHFIPGSVLIRYGAVTRPVFEWLVQLHAYERAHEYYLDGAETFLALEAARQPDEKTMRSLFAERLLESAHAARGFLQAAEHHARHVPRVWSNAQRIRLWHLHQWIHRPRPELPATNLRPSLELLLDAFRLGVANEADVYDHLIGPRLESGGSVTWGGGYWDLGEVTRRHATRTYADQPGVLTIADRIRRHIVDIELNRGDTETPVSDLVPSIRSIPGADSFARVLAASARCSLQRGYSRSASSRQDALSHLLQVCVPTAEDKPEEVAHRWRALNMPVERLIEAVMYAPQWAAHVEATLRWKGLESAVWWFHAHTKDSQWSVERELRDQWQSAIAERTALSADDLTQGAVDVAWFKTAHAELGADHWRRLDEAARYASSGTGHARAQLFARAMQGELTETELLKRIRTKRHQDSVRALGLLPLSRGKKREDEIQRRYQSLQEFVRTARQFGSQRQASEKLAARLGQENLARTAGYADPLRLQWAMEVRAARDLAGGSLTAQAGDVTVTLTVDALGEVSLDATRKGKPLKAIPPATRKHPKVKELIERKTTLGRQRCSMRRSLEEMMCRRDSLTGAELKLLMRHPLAAPMLAQLVWINDGVMGYPREHGRLLTDFRGKSEPVLDKETLYLAHPHDLRTAGQWSAWQRDCFAHEYVQPFKQVFREYYPITAEERKHPDRTRRFAGQQVNPRRALALLGSRGWVVRPEEGVGRTFHHHDLTAWLTFEEAFHTPAEVEGLTLEGVMFTRRTKPDVVPLDQVEPTLFSEVMRDVDLVASVAHRGGVDPEATASTVEMRAALARETSRALGLDNVRCKDQHALIEGQLATYTVHLGSGVAHLLPGGMLFIVPVHAQHRGRLYLPFADDDPKTAETLSKILLLARDGEIKDPGILDQIRAAQRRRS